MPGQLISPSPLVTVPEPVPELALIVSPNCGVKVAVPALTADAGMVKEHVPVPVQVPPLQPVKTNPAEGVAVSTTGVPELKLVEQVPVVQLIPAGLLVTVPEPATVTLVAKEAVSKLALTNCTEFIVTVHDPVPVQAPLHPVKVDPAAATAFSVTELPWL